MADAKSAGSLLSGIAATGSAGVSATAVSVCESIQYLWVVFVCLPLLW